MRKKGYLLTVLALATALVMAFAVAGCKDDTGLTLSGFDVKENVTVNVGDTVVLEEPEVTDSTGVRLEVASSVTDGTGAFVDVKNGRFTATDTGGYTITYVVVDSGAGVHTKKTIVNVTGAAQSDVKLSAIYEKLVTVGDVVTVEPVADPATEDVTVSVTFGGNAVDVSENKFTAQNSGLYTVTLTADGGKATYSYGVFAQNAAQSGEVEIFDDAWADKEALLGGKRTDGEIVSSGGYIPNNRFGESGKFLRLTANSNGEIDFYVNVRRDSDYYESLAKEGYTHVGIWVYNTGEKSPAFQTYATGGSLGIEDTGIKAAPNRWTELSFRLTDDKLDPTKKSFVYGLPFYEDQSTQLFKLKGCDSSAEVYIDSIFAYKTSVVAPKQGEKKSFNIGEKIDADGLFDLDDGLNVDDYAYSYNVNGNPVAVTSQTQLKTLGDYDLYARPKQSSGYSGEAKVQIGIKDSALEISVTSRDILFGGSSVSVDMSEQIDVAITRDGTNCDYDASYEIRKGGVPVTVENGKFTADGLGVYTVRTTVVYDAGEIEGVTAFNESVFEVYSPDKPYEFVTREWLETSGNLTAGNIADPKQMKSEQKEFFGDRDGLYFMLDLDTNHSDPEDSSNSRYYNFVRFSPMREPSYYAEALKGGYEFKFDAGFIGESSSVYLGFFGYPKDADHVERGAWKTFTFDSDDVSKLNEFVLTQVWKAGHGQDTMFIGNFRIEKEASSSSAKIGNVSAGQNNVLGNLITNGKLNGRETVIESVTVTRDGKTIALSKNSNFAFAPSYNGVYTLNIALRSGSLIGSVQEDVNVTDGKDVPEKIEDTDLHRIWGETEQLDLSALGGYWSNVDLNNAVVTVQRVRGEERLAQSEVTASVSGKNLVFTGLTAGDWFVEIEQFDANGTAPFNTAEIGSLTVSYDETEEYVYVTKEWLETQGVLKSGEIVEGAQIPAYLSGNDALYIKMPNLSTGDGISVNFFVPLHGEKYYADAMDKGYYLFFDFARSAGHPTGASTILQYADGKDEEVNFAPETSIPHLISSANIEKYSLSFGFDKIWIFQPADFYVGNFRIAESLQADNEMISASNTINLNTDSVETVVADNGTIWSGRTGDKYLKVTSTRASTGDGFNLAIGFKPVLDKAYYEKLALQGYVLKYDYYISGNRKMYSDGENRYLYEGESKWQTGIIYLTEIVKQWNSIFVDGGCDWGYNVVFRAYIGSNYAIGEDAPNGTVYIGNVRIEKCSFYEQKDFVTTNIVPLNLDGGIEIVDASDSGIWQSQSAKGKYFKISSTKDEKNGEYSMCAVFKPAYSKSYYEMLNRSGLIIKYDYYITGNRKVFYENSALLYDGNSEWRTLTILPSKIVELWSCINDGANWDWYMGFRGWIKADSRISGCESEAPQSTVYIGNFRVEKANA